MNYQKFYTNQIHSSSLLCQLAQMWKTQVLCDAMIKTGSITTKAHRVVLVAACPMLQSMDNATSGSHLEVRLAAEIKQDSINTFLQYLYEGFMMLTEDNVRDVEKIARLLQVDSIIKCCADFHKCLQTKTGAPSSQYKYAFHDMVEFRHVRSSDLQKTVHERMMKRPSEMSRPGSPGSKRQRSNRPSSPPVDVSSLGASDSSQGGPDPWDRVPQLGSGMGHQTSQWPSVAGRSSLEPGVIEIIEDSLELVQTVGPDKDSGPGGTRLDPRAVQKSVAISVASQLNSDTDLRIVNVPGDTETRTTYQTSTVPSAFSQGQGSHAGRSFSSFSQSSPLPSSKEKFSERPSFARDEPKKRPDIPSQRAMQQHSSNTDSHSGQQKMAFPVSISPIGQSKSFAAGSAEQVMSSANDLPSVRSPVTTFKSQPSSSHHSPMTPPSMSPSSSKGQSVPMRRPSEVSRPDVMDDSSSEKGQDQSRKESNLPQSSTADMTPDLSIVKVETKGTSYSANSETGGLDMYVDMPEHEQPDDDEGNLDYEEPSGDWSQEDDCSNISGDQSGAWYSGTYQGDATDLNQALEMISDGTYDTGNWQHGNWQDNRNLEIHAQCKFCHQYFQSEDSLRHHLKTYHGKDYLKICSLCGKCFFSAFGYNYHISIMHSTLKSGPQCNVCGKYFTCQSKLLIHLKSHNKEGDIKCPVCLKMFKHKHCLKGHSCKR